MKNKIKINLPKEISIYTIDDILEPIINRKMNCQYNEVSFDFRNIEWIEPTGVTVLSNLIEWLYVEEVKIFYLWNRRETASRRNYQAMKYLEDTGFFKLYNFPEYSGRGAYLRSTTLGIQRIEYKNYSQWSENEFLYWLQKQTGRKSPFTNIQVAVQEIFNNISDHSKVNMGCVFAQFYPKSNSINISFSDFGIGIPNSIRHKASEKSDTELLEYAVLEGVSIQSVPNNRGAGLWNIIRNLTNAEIGKVHICSNYGRIWYDNKEVKDKYESDVYYPGTFFEIKLDISNDELYEDEEEEDFGW